MQSHKHCTSGWWVASWIALRVKSPRRSSRSGWEARPVGTMGKQAFQIQSHICSVFPTLRLNCAHLFASFLRLTWTVPFRDIPASILYMILYNNLTSESSSHWGLFCAGGAAGSSLKKDYATLRSSSDKVFIAYVSVLNFVDVSYACSFPLLSLKGLSRLRFLRNLV